MIGLDYGTSGVKWFDGKKFGEGIPKGRGFVVGLTSLNALVKKASFPICRGRQLEKLILNEVSSDLSVEPSTLAVAYCPVKKEEKGCTFLIFVEKREALENLPNPLKEGSFLTLDVLGAASACGALYPDLKLTVVDSGAGKTSLIRVDKGHLTDAEIIRGGFSFLLKSPDRLLSKIGRDENLLLVGGGALSSEFRGLFKGFNWEVPKFSPFEELSPLYFNAFGLYHFKRAKCKASFLRPSLFSSEFFRKNRELLVSASVVTVFSLLLLSVGELLELKAVKEEYELLKSSVRKELTRLLGEKVVLPEVQVPEKLSQLKELKKLLKVDEPSVLLYLKAISDSLPEGVKLLELSGSVSSAQFTLSGRAENQEALSKFTERLKERFEKISTSISKEGKYLKFTITLWRVKVGA
jgi:hypothetical protein